MNHKNIFKRKKRERQTISSSKEITPLTMGSSKNQNSERIKELRKPRSRKHINDSIELQEMLSQLMELRKKAQYSSGNNQDCEDNCKNINTEKTDSCNGETDNIQRIEDSIDKNENIDAEEKIVNTESTNVETKDNNLKELEDVLDKNTKTETKIDKEIEALEKHIEAKLDSMAKETPIINERISVIYTSSLEDYLISCGLIKGTGNPVHSRNDMANATKDKDEKIIEHLKRGYDIFTRYRDKHNFLCLEIYRDTYCLIYKDGVVKTIK